jgi:transcription-repair coupling factor (superfamily II helicase)
LAQDLAAIATSELFARVSETPAVQSLARRLEQGGVLSLQGINQASQPFLAALLHQLFPVRPIVVVVEGLKTQEVFQQDLTTWLGIESETKKQRPGPESENPEPSPATTQKPSRSNVPLYYPSWEILPHESRLPHADVISERLETLTSLVARSTEHGAGDASPASIIVTSVVALLQRTFPQQQLARHTRVLNRGDRIDPLDLVEWLEDQGYEPEAQATQKGEMSLRGGILDLYPLTSPWPVRLEFFGDEVESLRHYDPLTQISREEVASITVPPAGELGILKKLHDSQAASSERLFSDSNSKELQMHSGAEPQKEFTPPVMNERKKAAEKTAAVQHASRSLERGKISHRMHDSHQLQRSAPDTLLGYLPRETILLLCGVEQLAKNADEYAAEVPQDDPFFILWDDFQQQAIRRGMTVINLAELDSNVVLSGEEGPQPEPDQPGSISVLPHSSLHSPHFEGLDSFRPFAERAPEPQIADAQRREFFAQLHRWLRQDYAVHVFCNNDGEQQRFTEIWRDYGLETHPGNSQGPGLSIHLGMLSRGFLCEEAKLVVVTDAEIFGRYKVQRPRRLKSPHAQATRSALDIDFTDLEAGDYVVHLQHGVGRYLGLQILPQGTGTRHAETANANLNSGQECLVIEYAPSGLDEAPPKLYVPVTEAHLVSKYVGTGKARPPLNTLGGNRWAKAKEHAERAVRDVAGDLLAIQAARESQAGHGFAPDTAWQREFEGAFIYEETPDQMRAILETKADMERPKPMDRLICGDVGFGKTEVGIRAAFKAVMDGKQVAVLVPTTVLAQQHFNTFRERMADYPVRIELLSRFRTRREQDKVVKDLGAGAVDIVIGTHRLLQGDITFKDLGLVVIDEEQRFGVMHKEKFKMLRKLVDVLTLSATPIPRTLYLALTGARDMSTIQTPPHDRLPVETIVIQYDERIIRDAIQRELNRGGQVFFLHNRVMTIDTMAAKLQTLLPKARIVVGHGQMQSDELEEVMTKFVNGEADVLLSTTIIESGLDIPNANTIIIDRADRFGLSDLYQLRGRVGRYKHQAYAYMLLPRHAGLLADVRKRLTAIKQYSTLGSGFKIAMRDLEIRGAGNLLGAEQSGHITAVGFELYCQLLKQSVAALKGEKVKPRIEVQVRLDFLSLNPVEQKMESKQEKMAMPEDGAPTLVSSTNSQAASAAIPFGYISDSRQRIEIYRKLAQATDKPGLEDLEKELRDRFGPLPPSMELLLQVAELKVLASEQGITIIEVKEDKLMLTRHNDFVMIGSKFPRLTRKTAAARLKEMKKLMIAL